VHPGPQPLLGISWPLVMEYLNKDMVHQTHQHIWQLKVKKPMIALSKMDQLEVGFIDKAAEKSHPNLSLYYSITMCAME